MIFILIIIILDCIDIVFTIQKFLDEMVLNDSDDEILFKIRIFMYGVIGISSIRILGRSYLISKWRN